MAKSVKKKKKKKRFKPFFTLLLIVGIILLLYPTVSNLWNYRQSKILSSTYDSTIKELPEEDLTKMWKEAKAYNKKHTENYISDAFTDSEDYILKHPYDQMLNPMNNGIMGYIVIPKSGIELPIYHGIGQDVLQKGAGHVEGSSLPIGGKGTHAVIAGHNGVPGAQLFTNIDKLVKGDEFYIHIVDKTFAYKVDQISVVTPDDTSGIAIEPDRDLVTLITCTPYGINSHRLLVRGTRVPYTEAKEFNMKGLFDVRTMLMLLALLSLIGSAKMLKSLRKKEKKHGNKPKANNPDPVSDHTVGSIYGSTDESSK